MKYEDIIDSGHLADYLTAEWGHFFAVYADGSTAVGQSVGMEINPQERPVVTIKCPGIDNLDSQYYTEGWVENNEDGNYVVVETGKKISLEEIIRTCCEDGDVSGEVEDLVENLNRETLTE